jgi:diguanylate cyclase (GGDEF)-like protein
MTPAAILAFHFDQWRAADETGERRELGGGGVWQNRLIHKPRFYERLPAALRRATMGRMTASRPARCVPIALATLLLVGCGIAPWAFAVASDGDRAPTVQQWIEPAGTALAPGVIAAGEFDSSFARFDLRVARGAGRPFWLRIPTPPGDGRVARALQLRKGGHLTAQVWVRDAAGVQPLPEVTRFPGFRATHSALYVLPPSTGVSAVLYARIETAGRGSEQLEASFVAVPDALRSADNRARSIAFAVGALAAVSLAALLIWFVLRDPVFILYTSLFSLQGLYITFFSGQGFAWPVLSAASPLTSHAWNVPAALSGAAACLFAREIADLQRSSPRSYLAFGWFAIAFVVLAAANVAQFFGLGTTVATVGNVMFLAVAAFTLLACLGAWRRGNSAAGWFVLAWVLLEGFTIATTASLLVSSEASDALLYYGLPLSMVAAAVLTALGVADRLREQRQALSEAQRRAQTDPLTGVLNRRSLLERLEAACVRAKARGLSIAVLFIDVDHFKHVNDAHGHQAGDACLKNVVTLIQAELRQSDVIGRYGGEEFVVILSSADAAAALPVAQRILERVERERTTGYGAPIRITCSIGVAASDALGVWGEPLLAHADQAVYAAKNGGRNRVEIAMPRAA